jgi:serine/threonine-protein kinase
MGVVWVAHSLVLGVDVALKLIRANAAGTGTSPRMAREAHAAARLGHPALVRVFDFGWTHRGDPFLVMELVQGETLSAMLERETRIAPIRAVQMILPIADGLRLAHSKNIVHRDIKPENIFLAKDSLGRTQPKLIDFGIAKIGPATYDGKLTQVGAVLGSPEYMSPEQALGVDDVDERTDIWSLSVVLYEMVTGSIPFRKPNYNALMRVIINDPPKPMPEYGVADQALWEVIERGLAKNRDQRWPNVTEFGEALALWLYEHGIKEDLSGNSIRAVWLDNALSGLRVDVPSSATPAAPDSKDRSLARVDTADELKRSTTASTQAPLTWAQPRNNKLVVGVAAALVGAGIAVGVVFGSRGSSGRAVPTGAPATSLAMKADPSLSAASADVDNDSANNPNPAPSAPAMETRAAPSSAVISGRRVAPSAPAAAVETGTAKAESGSHMPAGKTTAKPINRTSRRWHDFGF